MIETFSVVWGVKDIKRAIQFWTQALDYRLKREDEDFAILLPKPGRSGTQLSLKLVSSAKAQRHHLDLFTKDQAAEVERLLALGARRVEGWQYEADADYLVLQDPDGNPFCVCQL